MRVCARQYIRKEHLSAEQCMIGLAWVVAVGGSCELHRPNGKGVGVGKWEGALGGVAGSCGVCARKEQRYLVVLRSASERKAYIGKEKRSSTEYLLYEDMGAH